MRRASDHLWRETHAKRFNKDFGVDWPLDDIVEAALGKVLANPDGWGKGDLVPDHMARIFTPIGLIFVEREFPEGDGPALEERLNSASGKREVIRVAHEHIVNSDWFRALVSRGKEFGATNSSDTLEEGPGTRAPGRVGGERIWLVSLNRPVMPAIRESVPAIKADAAMRVFGIDTSKLTWAIVDSGIDTQHPAFLSKDGAATRVAAIYDFNLIRSILSIDRIISDTDRSSLEKSRVNGMTIKEVDERLKNIKRDVELERVVDWNLIAPLLKRPLETPPYSDHGTHVAGILAAGGPRKENTKLGVCPDIQLYDLRVSVHDREVRVRCHCRAAVRALPQRDCTLHGHSWREPESFVAA